VNSLLNSGSKFVKSCSRLGLDRNALRLLDDRRTFRISILDEKKAWRNDMPPKNAHILTVIKKMAEEEERMSKIYPMTDAGFENVDAGNQYI
jgi:hypothetical protein